jgi:redox-sensitive bicupin YhaK (pirin superfamily)
MLDGHMEHRDSMGNRGDLLAGGVQWMKAASGVIHSEMPRQTGGLMRGFQLWINLPAAEKMGAPAYQEFAAAHPDGQRDGARVKIISGELPASTDRFTSYTSVQYFDISLPSEGAFSPPDSSATAFLYPF